MANNQLKEELILSTQHFDQKIDDVIRKVNKLQSQGNKAGNSFNSSMGGMISKANGFGNSLGSILGIAGKLSGVLGGITAGVNLADWFSNSVKEGVRLAEAGEGIRLAFDRLNKGNLLAKLREETHNTVTDIELMKQAVKFNDFNLDVEQMGKFLAYAQMKAKDTGESIDYMVNSITTGLGRKSLPILDNLGLSAAEIKEEMAKGGDMVTAVTKIIEKRMKEAGDYVDTAADRAKKRETELQNNLEELGRTFQPLSEASATFWHSLEIGAIQALNSLAPVINKLTEAGRILNQFNNMGGDAKVNRMIANLGDGSTQGQKNMYRNQMKEFDKHIKKYEDFLRDIELVRNNNYDLKAIERINKSGLSDPDKVKEQLEATRKMRDEYQRKAQNLFKSNSKSPTTETSTDTTTGTSSKKNKVYAEGSLGWYQQKISELQEKQKDATTNQEYNDLAKQIKHLETLKKFVKEGLEMPPIMFPEGESAISKQTKEMQEWAEKNPLNLSVKFDSSLTSTSEKIKLELKDILPIISELGSSLSGLGQTLEEPILNIAGVMAQAIATIIMGYAEATKMAAEIAGPWGWLAFGAVGLGELVSIISTIKSMGAYANGGIVGGSSYAGDRLYARVNSGEMILNPVQQSHLFNMINNGGAAGATNGSVHFVIKGSDLYGTLKNYNGKMNKVR